MAVRNENVLEMTAPLAHIETVSARTYTQRSFRTWPAVGLQFKNNNKSHEMSCQGADE